MIEVQIVARDRNEGLLFFTLGLGVSYAAAKSQAMANARARIAGNRSIAERLHTMTAERI